MQRVNVESLDGLSEMDHVFNLSPVREHNDNCDSSYDVVATYRDALDYPPGKSLGYAPEVFVPGIVDDYGDVHITGEAWICGDGWEFFSRGYTGQFGAKLSDPVMHESEFVGGRLARDMIQTGGTFVATSVHIDLDGDDGSEPVTAGWVVLRKIDD